MVDDDTINIAVKRSTHERLSKYGSVIDSFDDVITNVLDRLEGKKPKK